MIVMTCLHEYWFDTSVEWFDSLEVVREATNLLLYAMVKGTRSIVRCEYDLIDFCITNNLVPIDYQ